jgi:hypothetical protein
MGVHVEILGRARLGWARQARARRGSTHCGEESPQKSGMLWQSRARIGKARPGVVRQGKARRGKYTASHGVPQFARRGSAMVWRGKVRQCRAWQTHCPSNGDRSLRLGKLRTGEARRGAVWRGEANTLHLKGCRSLLGMAWHGKAGRGVARQIHGISRGVAVWRGMAGHGAVRLGMVGRGKHTALQGGQKFAVGRGGARQGAAGRGAARPGKHTASPRGC